MDNFDDINVGGQGRNDPIPFDDDAGEAGVSHAPLDLGGTSPVTLPATPKPAARPSPSVAAAAGASPAKKAPSTGRVESVKTFFTKLHPGAIAFLDEQITRWLSENPQVEIKLTNVTVGEVQGKKNEPNILITVWF